jgi:diaminopimelate epimerase
MTTCYFGSLTTACVSNLGNCNIVNVSSASAAVVVRLGLCDSPLTVKMPGGPLSIEIDKDYQARMTGPAWKVAEGKWHATNDRLILGCHFACDTRGCQ